MFRATEGCHDPRTAARTPKYDQPCNYTPGIFQAGFCQCTDDIPRHIQCGMGKKPCKEMCAEPPPKSTLPGSVQKKSPTDHPPTPAVLDAAEPPFYLRPAFVVGVAIAIIVLAAWFTRPVKNERHALQRLVALQRRQDQIEASFAHP